MQQSLQPFERDLLAEAQIKHEGPQVLAKGRAQIQRMERLTHIRPSSATEIHILQPSRLTQPSRRTLSTPARVSNYPTW